MIHLFNFLALKTFGFLIVLFESEGASAAIGVYEVETKLTPIGWATVVIFSVAVIFGVIHLTIKTLKKPKLK